jgi:hypothetical protein
VRDEIAFYETMVTSRNWMDLWVEPKAGGGTTVKFGIESNGADLGSVLVWTGDWKAGVWHQFVIHVHWSTDKTKGLVDIWFDGQQVVTAYKHQTKFDTNDMFFQTGLHRVLMQPYTETLYVDDFIESDTQDEAKIAVPNPNGGGGTADGGTDAAGGGGNMGGAGAATAGTNGAAGTGTTTGQGGQGGSSGATGTAGGAATGTAGGTSMGQAGQAGQAGSSGTTTGAAGNHARASSGCAYVDTRDASRFGLAAILALVGAVVFRRKRR